MTPHGHHQFFEPFLDSDVIRIEIFGFQNSVLFNLVNCLFHYKINKLYYSAQLIT
jgi:hypothetical protein